MNLQTPLDPQPDLFQVHWQVLSKALRPLPPGTAAPGGSSQHRLLFPPPHRVHRVIVQRPDMAVKANGV